MKRRVIGTLAVASTALAIGGCGSSAETTTGAGPTTSTLATTTVSRTAAVSSPALATQATNGLALSLLPRLGGTGNLVFSPYSVQNALAMADQGAAGSTATVLNRVLGGAASATTLGRSEGALTADIRAAIHAHGPSLNNADAVWVQSGLPIEKPFASALSDDFGVAPQTADFKTDPGGATQTINGWVANLTHQLIPKLFPAGSINRFTAMVLVNAIYLQARWSEPFDPNKTAAGTFTTAPGSHVSAQFMNSGSESSYPYAKGTGWVAVGQGYAHSTLQLLAVMPTLGTLGSFQSKLSASTLATIAHDLKDQSVDLSIPKLSLNLQTDLTPQLKALGLTDAFGARGNFSKITKAESLGISAVEHDAVLKIDEKGTVAAAATGTILSGAAAGLDPVELNLDHPFLLFLRDTHTGAILFAGRVADPSAPAG